MKKLPSVSVIIPTFNRKYVLKEALISLNKVDYPRKKLEVVVVSDGSTDGTPLMIKEVKDKLNYKFKFINGKKGGISYAKNTAIKNSKGEIIVSTDDDCLFESLWLKKMVRPFKDPGVGCVGGPDRAIEKDSILAKSVDYAFSSFIGSGGIHGRPLPFRKIKLGKFYPIGCNMAFPKRVVKKIGFFDERLAPGEETDFNHRLEKAGFKLIHIRGNFVWHRPRNSLLSLIPRSYKRGAARVEIIRRHYRFAEIVYFLPALMVLGALFLLIASIFDLLFLKVFCFLLAFYFLIILIAGFSAFLTYRHPLYFFLVPLLILCQHAFHGLGFLTKSIEFVFKKE